MQSFKLKRTKKNAVSQYFMLHTTRVDTATKISFQSIACIYSQLKFDMQLTAFERVRGTTEMVKKDSLLVPRHQVRVLPMSWFEEELQVRMSHFDANLKEESK